MKHKVLCLFDVDGTLTKSRQSVTNDMTQFLQELRTKANVGLVGGSDLKKIEEQMGSDVTTSYDYVFAENGLIAYRNGTMIGKQSILEHVGEEKLQTFINFCLLYMSGLKLPAKRGNFVEFRTGLINVSPIGRGCSQQERDFFEKYDKEHKVREKFVAALEKQFPDLGLVYSIGGQISFDVYPKGWDKTFCLQYFKDDGFETIHFFGDKTFQGGNDYELFSHPRTTGHHVKNPDDTKKQVTDLFFI